MIKKRFELVEGVSNGKESVYHLNYGEDTLMFCEEDEKEPLSQLVVALNNILQEKEVETLAYIKMKEFYETLISNTVQDKLKDIDNIYAMKMMLTEMCTQFEGLTKTLEGLSDEQDNE